MMDCKKCGIPEFECDCPQWSPEAIAEFKRRHAEDIAKNATDPIVTADYNYLLRMQDRLQHRARIKMTKEEAEDAVREALGPLNAALSQADKAGLSVRLVTVETNGVPSVTVYMLATDAERLLGPTS